MKRSTTTALDRSIRLQCLEVAEGDLGIAKNLYVWVMNKEPKPAAKVSVRGAPVPRSGADHVDDLAARRNKPPTPAR
jgi:hypothetical protein